MIFNEQRLGYDDHYGLVAASAQPLLQSTAGDSAAKSCQTLSAVWVAAPTISVIFCGWLIVEDIAALDTYRLNRRRLKEIFGKGFPMFLEARFRNKTAERSFSFML